MTIKEFIETFEDHTSTKYCILEYNEDTNDFEILKTFNYFEELADSQDFDYREISTDKGISLHSGQINIYLE